MAKTQKKKEKVTLISSIIVCLALIFSVFYSGGYFNELTGNSVSVGEFEYSDMPTNSVHFVDCGQGDCEVIISQDTVTLIDTGSSQNESEVLDYLSKLKIDTIDYMVLTHPHEDHIGNATELIEKYGVDNLIMRKCTDGTTPTTSFYEDLIDSIIDNHINVISATTGYTFSAGDFNYKILGPLTDYTGLNDQSLVIKANCGKTDLLFEGDASSKCETDMIKFYSETDTLDCDILKVGHHGSSSSSCDSFLNAVSPSLSVISCGIGNSYGHPSGTALEIIEKYSNTLLRTDINSSTIVTINENGFDVDCLKES